MIIMQLKEIIFNKAFCERKECKPSSTLGTNDIKLHLMFYKHLFF